MSVKRYDFHIAWEGYDPIGVMMKENLTGDYVTYTDYVVLEIENAELLAEKERRDLAVVNLCSENATLKIRLSERAKLIEKLTSKNVQLEDHNAGLIEELNAILDEAVT